MANNHNKNPSWLSGLGAGSSSVASGQEKLMPSAGAGSSSYVRTQRHSVAGAPESLGLAAQLKQEVHAFFFDTKLNILLLAFPFACISRALDWSEGATLVLSMLALCPLAERLGFITEQLAMYTNDTLGGLLNATFGNATEVIISGFALQHGYVRVVQLSLLGSVVSNLLLVMGTAFLAGGIRHSTQNFNKQGINVNCALLLLGTCAVLLPSMLSETGSEASEGKSELALSRFISLFLLLLYLCYLLFQLYTHRFLYDESGDDGSLGRGTEDQVEAGTALLPKSSNGYDGHSNGTVQRTASSRLAAATSSGLEMVKIDAPSSGTALRGPAATNGSSDLLRDTAEAGTPRSQAHNGLDHMAETDRPVGDEDDDDAKSDESDEDELVLSKTGCFIWLAAVTVIIALLSEWIMDVIQGASKSLGVPMPFLVTILLPIVGNAAEHASAVVFAWKNKMEIALGVAVGSSTQVAVLIIPFCVILAWMMGRPLDLDFNSFETSVYFMSVLVAVVTVQDGSSNWLKGTLLLVMYVMISAGFWLHKDQLLDDEDKAPEL